MKTGVLFVGVGIFPHRVAGDKNFLLDLRQRLESQGRATGVVSIVSATPPEGAAGFTFVNRFLHRRSDRFIKRGQDGAIAGYRHPHGVVRTWAELSCTLIRARGAIRQALGPWDRAVIHWCDSSLLLPSLRAACGGEHRYVASVLRYVPANRAAARLRTLALKAADCVLTGTDASRKMLVDDGCLPDRVLVEPWGCPPGPGDRAQPAGADGGVRLLWAGFLQQIGRTDLLRTIQMAHGVRRQRRDVHFTFSLKPECFSAEFASLSGPGVEVTSGSPAFRTELPAFDGLLSPVIAAGSTPAPPLTWLEAMAVGVPIVTTDHRGVDEVVTDGVSGIVAADYDRLEATLLDPALKARLAAMRPGAREQHRRRYDIETVASRYASVYAKLLQ